jgi:RimJ/RimL family protein N-acetyltransferase
MAAPIRTLRLQLVPLDPAVIRHLIDGQLAEAERLLGATLPIEFPNEDELAGFLPVQLQRMESAPDRRQWMARIIRTQSSSEGEIVGHCGFHGPPEIIGRAEIGYTVFTAYRNQGYATEAAKALVGWAFEQGESKVFASLSPANAPSLAVVRKLGFTQVGAQEDEVDGLELVFAVERSSR